jgi:hypothetical protein
MGHVSCPGPQLYNLKHSGSECPNVCKQYISCVTVVQTRSYGFAMTSLPASHLGSGSAQTGKTGGRPCLFTVHPPTNMLDSAVSRKKGPMPAGGRCSLWANQAFQFIKCIEGAKAHRQLPLRSVPICDGPAAHTAALRAGKSQLAQPRHVSSEERPLRLNESTGTICPGSGLAVTAVHRFPLQLLIQELHQIHLMPIDLFHSCCVKTESPRAGR